MNPMLDLALDNSDMIDNLLLTSAATLFLCISSAAEAWWAHNPQTASSFSSDPPRHRPRRAPATEATTLVHAEAVAMDHIEEARDLLPEISELASPFGSLQEHVTSPRYRRPPPRRRRCPLARSRTPTTTASEPPSPALPSDISAKREKEAMDSNSSGELGPNLPRSASSSAATPRPPRRLPPLDRPYGWPPIPSSVATSDIQLAGEPLTGFAAVSCCPNAYSHQNGLRPAGRPV